MNLRHSVAILAQAIWLKAIKQAQATGPGAKSTSLFAFALLGRSVSPLLQQAQCEAVFLRELVLASESLAAPGAVSGGGDRCALGPVHSTSYISHISSHDVWASWT